jgi:hypothetical protein
MMLLSVFAGNRSFTYRKEFQLTRRTLAVAFFLISLTACSPQSSPPTEVGQPSPVEVAAQPTSEPPPIPTFTLEPTATTVPTTTPLPQGVLFRDDFNGTLQPGWIWDVEDPAKWYFVDIGEKQWLQIIGNPARSNVLMRDLPPGNFAIIVHVRAEPYMNFHQANIFVFEDTSNYVAVNTGYCQPCAVGGHGYFMETVSTGATAPQHHYEAPRAPEDTDVYLKIEAVDGVISGYFATVPGEWTRIGRFGNFFELKSIGLSATNSSPPSGTPEDIIAQFDYFEVILP